MTRRERRHSTVNYLAIACAALLVVAVFLLFQSLSLSRALSAERAGNRAIESQVRVLAARAQDARTPELLLHRFLIAWVTKSGAEANLYMAPELQETWRRSLALAGWEPGPRGLTIDHYRVDDAKTGDDGARFRLTLFGGTDESSPAYTMTVTITGHPGAYAITGLEVGGVREGPAPPPGGSR